MFFSSINLQITLLLLFSFPILVRWLSWLNILQKKEYRLDRLVAFIKTKEGIRQVFKLLPARQDFTRHGLRRPKPTLRVLLIAAISATASASVIIWSWHLPLTYFFVILVLLILATPDLILLASALISLGAKTVTQLLLFLARRKTRQHSPIIIGITGSYGKTSTKHLLTHLLNYAQPDSAFTTQRSFNTPLSVAMQVLRHYHGQQYLVLEYAAYRPGEIRKLAQIFQPQLAIITGFTPQHLAIFGSEENIIKAKAELIESLPPKKHVFYNQDVDGVKQIVNHALKQRKTPVQITPFVEGGASSRYDQVELNSIGQLCFALDGELVKTRFIGRQYLSVVQGAVAAAKQLGLTNETICQGLRKYQPNKMFVQFYQQQQGFWVLDDGGTANPAGFRAALDLASELIETRQPKGKKILITAGLIDLAEQTQAIHKQLATQSKPIFTQVCYLGEPGKQEFASLFQDNLVDTIADTQALLVNLTKDDFVMVEGKLPQEIEVMLSQT